MKNTIVLYAIAMLMILTAEVAQGQGKGQTHTFNYDYTHNYVVEWKEEDGKLNIKITKGELSDSFTIEKELDNAIFITAFKGIFKEVVLEKGAKENLDNTTFTKVINQANNVLFYIKAQSLADDDRPKAGDITIAKELEIIKFTEDWRLKCNRVKECSASGQNPDSLSIYAVFFKSILYLTKTPEEFEQNKTIIREAIHEIKIALLDMDNEIKNILDSCFSYTNKNKVEQTELNQLNARFRYYDNKYSQELENFIRGVGDKCKPENRKKTKDIKDEYYYKRKESGTMSIVKQYQVHEIKKERRALLKVDQKKIEWSSLFLTYTQQHLKEKQDAVKQIQDTLNRLNGLEAKRVDIENKTKPIKELDTQIEELKESIKKDESILDSAGIYNRLENRYKAYEKLNNKLLKDIEKIENGNVNLETFWNDDDEFDFKEFKKQKPSIQKSIVSVLRISLDDRKKLSVDDFSYPVCKDISECKKRINLELGEINIALIEIQFFNTTTKKERSCNIEKKKTSINNLKREQKDLKDIIQKLQNDSEYQNYCEKYKIGYDDLTAIKDSINKDIRYYNDRKEKVSKNVKYLEALSQKLEQQKVEIEKESIQQTFIVDSIQLEFYEGLIENIWVRGHLKNDKSTFLKFENRSPIRFSSKKAYDKNSTIWLTASGDEDVYWVLYMGELLTYLQNHDNGTKDFSPANGSIIIKDFDKAIALKKQATFKILEAHVYSDFVGFNANSPNGLIQTEISKRFNIATKRYGSFLRKDAVYCKCAGPVYSVNWGFLNFIRPSFVFSKFEDKERLLPAKAYHEIINGQLQSIKYVSTKDILQHEIFSVGTVVNIVTLDMPIQKSIIKLNIGYRFGRTELTDSVYQYQDNKISAVADNNYGLNTMRGFIELDYRVTPQKRYGVGTSIRFVYMQSFTDNAEDLYQFNRVNQYSDIDLRANQFNNWMVRFDASGFFKPAKESDNKLFLRYRFHGQLNDLNYNFHQLQVGYSFYLLRNNLNSNKGPK